MYVLHYFPDTASIAPRMVLADLGVPHHCHLIDREGGALDSPAYRALQPLGKIPALETPDGPIFETAAMLLFLADRHAALLPTLAPNPASPDRAAFLKWFFFTSTNIHPTLLDLFYPDRVAGEAAVPAVQAAARARMQVLLSTLNTAALGNPAWMPDNAPSILGYYVGMLIHWLGSYDAQHPSYFRSQEFPALHRVLLYLEARPAAQKIAADEGLGALPFTAPYA
jgi:glutathione S-transferase